MSCHVSQPTLSQQLRALEERLGVPLVERRFSGAELTPIGRDIAERGRRVLVEIKDIRNLARRAAEGAAGTVRLGVTPTLGPYLLPPIVAALHSERPDLKLYIREGIPDDQVLELARGEIDLLLGPLPIAGEGLTIEPLFREPLRLVASPDHPLAGRPVEREALLGAPILSLDQRDHFHRQVAGLCAEYGMQLLRDYEGTSLDSIQQMVASGLGLAVLPDCYLRSESGGTTGMAVLDVKGWNAWRAIAAVWRQGAAYADTFRSIAERVQREARLILQ